MPSSCRKTPPKSSNLVVQPLLIKDDKNELPQIKGSGRWAGEHCRTNQMLRVISHILLEDLFIKLTAVMIKGVPNLLNAKLPSNQVASLLSTDNFPTVAK